MPWQFSVDRGGTFTDVLARAPDGRLIQKKLLSVNPARYPDPALAGIRAILSLAEHQPIPTGLIESVRMGTTVGTNALLTGTGEPVALVVTHGFADLPIIGDQSRPDIFALHITRPAPLHALVIEADERMSSEGTPLQALDVATLEARLGAARAHGIKACAIAFLHAWKNLAHELAAGALAERLGFTQVSLSHQVSALVKYLPRMETAVLDAYLTPPLGRYVDQVRNALPEDCRLEFMQSNGGLTPACEFKGKDSVLSGPAGGLIGMIKCGRAAGFDKLIGFDMGGTSTDVSLFAGELERQSDARIAGHRIRIPMLAVHTVAAGGGSILHFDGNRLLTGPDSAGSLPGPLSYRNGGPLTVTDANLFLGRIQASQFPALFGPSGDLPLDAAQVAEAFQQQTSRVNQALALDYTPERLAEGFLEIAVENMADAIRHITLERGVNPAEFTLVCFGGAGGQLACRVADRLGIRRVLAPPYAAVLSAYGISLAERRALRQIAIERPLDACLDAPGWSDGPAETRGEDTEHRRALLRYTGSDTTLAVALAESEVMAAEFHALHKQRFGFADTSRRLILTAIETETVSGGAEPEAHSPRSEPRQATTARVYLSGNWQSVPLHQRPHLMSGQTICGPALIVEPGSCHVLEPGWSATLNDRGDLILTAANRADRTPPLDRPDPTWLSLFNRRFMSIAEDMGRVLQMTARSVNIRERLDFSCALFDNQGQLIANAPHIPVHLGSMGDSVKAILTAFPTQVGTIKSNPDGYFGHPPSTGEPGMRPGDAFLINSPYHGGTHLPDITVVRPIFSAEGALCYFTAARAHHADVGGIAPGSMPALSTRIEEEGCLSAGMRIVSEGHFLTDSVHAWLHSSTPAARNPDQNIADLQAQLAACMQGETLLRQLETEVGIDAVLRYMVFVQDNAESAVLRLLDKLHGGRFVLPLDGGARIAVRVDIEQNRAEIDFSGSSPMHAGNLNAPAAIVRSAVLYVFRSLLDVDIPLNAGVLRPISIRLPTACLLNPQAPAAVVAGNVETSQHIVDALYAALGVLAASQGTMNNLSLGDGQHQYYETVCGGTGAGASFDGASAVHSHMTNSRLTDPEILELNLPVRVEQFAIRTGSGGSGRYRGGDGCMRKLRYLAAMKGNLIALRRNIAPHGLNGGQAGLPGRQWIERADGRIDTLSGVSQFDLEPGDLLVLETPGGGGYGSAQ